MKNQKKPWPLATKITVIASVVTIIGGGGIWGFYHSIFGQKTESKSPILSPKDSDTVTLKISVTDTEGLPLKDVDVTVVSDRKDPKRTDDKGFIDFSISLNSAQVSITLSKEGYETKRDESIRINPNKVETFVLKKKR
jgi:hypothetical protein